MDRTVGAAAGLSQIHRADLAILALVRSEPISDLAVQHGVSRKFVYQQAGECQGRCRLTYVMIPPIEDVAALAASMS